MVLHLLLNTSKFGKLLLLEFNFLKLHCYPLLIFLSLLVRNNRDSKVLVWFDSGQPLVELALLFPLYHGVGELHMRLHPYLLDDLEVCRLLETLFLVFSIYFSQKNASLHF